MTKPTPEHSSSSAGFTLVEVMISLAVGAFIMLALGSVMSFSAKSTQANRLIATRDAVLNAIRRAAGNPIAIRNSSGSACLTSATSCTRDVKTPFSLYDTSGKQLTGPDGGTIFYYQIDGTGAAGNATYPIQATTYLYPRCPTSGCTTASAILEIHYTVSIGNTGFGSAKSITGPAIPITAQTINDGYMQ